MAAPTERVTRVRGEYAKRIVAEWLLDQGPHVTDGFCPLQNCPEIHDAVTAMLQTKLLFNMQVSLTWETRKDGQLDHWSKGRNFSVDPNTLAGGNNAEYTWERLLRALNEEFMLLMENEKFKQSGVTWEHLENAEVQLSAGKALNSASARGKP